MRDNDTAHSPARRNTGERRSRRGMFALGAAACVVCCIGPILATPIAENIEVVGTAAHYIDGDDIAGWKYAMQLTVKDRDYREQLSAQTRLLDMGSDDNMIASYLGLMT